MCAVARQNCVNSNDMEKVFNLAANWICRSGSFPSSHFFLYKTLWANFNGVFGSE